MATATATDVAGRRAGLRLRAASGMGKRMLIALVGVVTTAMAILYLTSFSETPRVPLESVPGDVTDLPENLTDLPRKVAPVTVEKVAEDVMDNEFSGDPFGGPMGELFGVSLPISPTPPPIAIAAFSEAGAKARQLALPRRSGRAVERRSARSEAKPRLEVP